MDLHSAFMQIKLKPQDKEKLAFITEFGKYQPSTLNYCLKISSTTFAELMDKVLEKFDKNFVRYYIDYLSLFWLQSL